MASEMMELELEVNGELRTVQVSSEARLLDVLRDTLGLTGAKEGCGRGECGACSVLLDGALVNACMVPAFQAHRRSVETVEGLGQPGSLGPVQQAFVKQAAVQCGFCTPGMILTAYGLLRRNPHPTYDQIVDGMEDNLCRCGAHTRIVEAIQAAAVEMEGGR